ncbi:MAG: hypothetical protein WBA45_00760 [Microthrixaceae bacterium]
MNTRRSLSLLAIVASLALFAGACSGSDEDSSANNKAETTVKDNAAKDGAAKDSSKENGTAEDVDSTDTAPKSLSNKDFTAQLGKINDEIKAAGTDPCAIALAQDTEPPEPTNATQVADVVGTYSLLLRSMAGALPSASSANAKALTNAADAIDKSAKDAGYSGDFFSSEGLRKVMTDPGVNAGITEFTAATKDCPGLKSVGEAQPQG